MACSHCLPEGYRQDREQLEGRSDSVVEGAGTFGLERVVFPMGIRGQREKTSLEVFAKAWEINQ